MPTLLPGIAFPVYILPILAAGMALPAVGGDGAWQTLRSGSWQTNTNWTGNSIASGVGATADFSTVDLTADITITLDGETSLGAIMFGDAQPGNGWSVRPGTGGTLRLEKMTGIPRVEVTNGITTLGVNLEGPAGMEKSGSGTLVLSAQNSYSGPTMISQGTLRLGCPPAFPAGMQVMPLGDSITFGYNGSNAGYRGPLYDLLRIAAPDFRYVGTSQENAGYLPASPVNQRYNEGHSSYSIQDSSNNLDGFDNATFLRHGGKDRNPNGGYWLLGGNGTNRPPMFPDTITMMLGTNDLYFLPGVDERLRSLIAKITTLRPDARLLVAKITPIFRQPPDVSHLMVPQYNAVVETVVAEFRSQGKQVHLVDMNTNFPPNGMDPDGVHPNSIGFNWMAIQWYEALHRAHAPLSSVTTAIPAGSAVSVAQGAALDLANHRATVASLDCLGRLDLGNQGLISAASIILGSSAEVGGSGTLRGDVVHDGTPLGGSGESLFIDGQMTNNGTLDGNAASIHVGGTFINNGSATIDLRQMITFGESIINNGVLRVIGNGAIPEELVIINNGILDIITGPDSIPGLVNHGVILDASDIVTRSHAVTDEQFLLTIDSFTGHEYQLQKSSSLEEGTWQNVGSSQQGETGCTLEFSDIRTPEDGHCFYRVRVFP